MHLYCGWSPFGTNRISVGGVIRLVLVRKIDTQWLERLSASRRSTPRWRGSRSLSRTSPAPPRGWHLLWIGWFRPTRRWIAVCLNWSSPWSLWRRASPPWRRLRHPPPPSTPGHAHPCSGFLRPQGHHPPQRRQGADIGEDQTSNLTLVRGEQSANQIPNFTLWDADDELHGVENNMSQHSHNSGPRLTKSVFSSFHGDTPKWWKKTVKNISKCIMFSTIFG